MEIIGYYKDYALVKDGETYKVASKQSKKVITKGTEEWCSKIFIMLVAGFIDENLTKIEPK